jgi:hypothetical protein
MTKSAQLWPGDKMRDFFRAVFRAEKDVDAALAERLADACVARINRMLVIDEKPVGPSRPVPRLVPNAGEEPATPGFDPFAFSAVVTLSRRGKDGLLRQLEEINSALDLRQLADAQHLGVDPSITDIDELRTEIVKGAERRIAERRAAAS